jgi:hypothetical protein
LGLPPIDTRGSLGLNIEFDVERYLSALSALLKRIALERLRRAETVTLEDVIGRKPPVVSVRE